MLSTTVVIGLFLLTAFAELSGCYLVYQWLKLGAPAWVIVPAALCLAAFAWLLTLHPSSAGRTYAAYGGAYIFMSVLWIWAVESQRPDRWDVLGAAVSLVGMSIIAFGPREGGS